MLHYIEFFLFHCVRVSDFDVDLVAPFESERGLAFKAQVDICTPGSACMFDLFLYFAVDNCHPVIAHLPQL
ncbi:hypothetical protein D0T25_02160 [Duganella sp. BJB488]|nr:hypothetical protein D0T25_02160 [Duganella sp. BJB488]RFP36919.1 hypothetical protein D0T24_09425 [Duganella sp. BJB480]